MLVSFDTKIEPLTPQVTTAELMELIKTIKKRLSYGRVFSHYGLQWAGDSDHQLSCPFHGEDRNPSCHYYEEDRRIWCFTCAAAGDSANAGGDVVWFVKRMEELPTMFAAVARIEQIFSVTGRRDLMDRMHDTSQEDEDRRKLKRLHSMSVANKVNDLLVVMRRTKGESVRLDKLEHAIFLQKRKIDAGELQYETFVGRQQQWYDWAMNMLTEFVAGGS